MALTISKYSDLVRLIRSWTNRADLTDDNIQEFLYFAGSQASQILRVPAMEDIELLDVSPDGHCVIPYDFQQLRGLTCQWSSETSVPLERVSWDQYINYRNNPDLVDNTARYFARQGPYWFIAPNPPVGAKVTCHYYRTMPNIDPSNEVNWLVQMAPLVYLYGALHYAFLFLFDEERSAFWEQKYNSELQRVQDMADTAEYKGTRLAVRSVNSPGDF
jgi:hypothetical protein